jgi:hypothetical protein
MVKINGSADMNETQSCTEHTQVYIQKDLFKIQKFVMTGTSFNDWAQLSRFSLGDGDRIQSLKCCFK